MNQQHPFKQPGLKKKFFLLSMLILLATSIVYLPSLKNNFTNWDDEAYILYNPLISPLSPGAIVNIFTTIEYMGGYIPVTLTSYAVEHYFFGDNPLPYHAFNLIVHLLNSLLVFLLMFLLTEQTEVAFVTALLFSVHPLHVESVAWLSGRKDLLFAFFYLASLICYVQYVKYSSEKKIYRAALILFLLSLLSKGMAVTLPVVMFLLDYILKRKITKKAILEKTPFIILAFVFGVIGVFTQDSAKAIQHDLGFSFVEKIALSCQSIIQYLIKLFAPIHLSAFYPYPEKIEGMLPLYVWICAGTSILLALVVTLLLRHSPKLLFGILFFFFTIAIVLQILPIGRAQFADRWTYIPSIGIFYLLAKGYCALQQFVRKKFRPMLTFVHVCLPAYVIWFSILTWQRCDVWHDSITLWTDVINQYPNVPDAYKGRASAYASAGNFQSAFADYDALLALTPQEANAYIGKGNIYTTLGRNEEAIRQFTKAIEVDPAYPLSYYNRGTVYARIGQIDLALTDLSSAILHKPDYADAYVNRGVLQLNRGLTLEACSDFKKAADMNHDVGKKLLSQYCR